MKPSRQSILIIAVAATVFVGAIAFAGTTFSNLPEGQDRKQSTEKALEDVRSNLKSTKRALAREGKYSCCISPSCDFCAIAVGKCPCSENLSNGDPVCHECKGGWEAGYGALDDVKASEVKTLSKEGVKMMYDARAKKYLQKR